MLAKTSEKRETTPESLKSLSRSSVLLDRVLGDFNNRYEVSSLSTKTSSKGAVKLLAALQDGLKRLEDGKKLVAECEERKMPGGGLF